jgi:hypothetical protein
MPQKNLVYSEQEQKFIRLMLDAGAQGNEVSTSCEKLVMSLRKRRITSEDFLAADQGDSQLIHELKVQTLRANRLQAELHELSMQHTRQLEYLINLKSPTVTGRVHWTK